METKRSISSIVMLSVFSLALTTLPALGQVNGNSALSFNGTSDLVIVPNSPLLELTDGTLELWFRPDWAPGSLVYDPALIAERLGAVLTRFSLHVERNLAGVALANGTSVSTVPYAFTRGQWYHLALVDSGATAQVYVNGQFIGTTANGFGTIIGLPLELGSDGIGEFFQGQMDEVRIWNVARSTTDIRANLSRALAGNEAGLVAYWRMNEGLGTKITDATTNRLDGTLLGPAWVASGVTLVNTAGALGTALDLTASRNTYVQVAAAPSLALSNQLTFEAWIRPRTAQCSTILSRGDGTNLAATDYIFQVGTDGTNCGVMKVALMVAGGWVTSASTVPTNAWTHVAVTYNGTNKQFYINGVLDRAWGGTGGVYQSSSPLFIGRQGSVCTCNFFDGGLGEVRVWNTARSATEIQANLNRAVMAETVGLVGYWRFNEQAGMRAFDASGQGNHGTLLNRPVPLSSFWAPVMAVNGANPLTQECHVGFADAGATASGVCFAITTGGRHSLALRADGQMVGWGQYGQSTFNSIANATGIIAVAANNDFSWGLKGDGSVVSWIWGLPGQTSLVEDATNIVAIAGGGNHSLALKADGTVLALGNNDYGQINVPSSATNVVAITAGGQHSLALKADGTLVGWGRNDSGQISIPLTATKVVAVSAGGYFSLALKADGTVVGWGDNCCGQLNIPASASNLIGIAAGSRHCLAVKEGGAVIGWGWNAYNQINVPAGAANVVAVAAGDGHSLALRADGIVLGWGLNESGQCTPPSNLTNLNIPVTARGSVNPDLPGTYVLTYSATNTAGGIGLATRVVTVQDTKPPILTLAGVNPLTLDVGTPFVDPGATASDACEGDLSASIVRSGTVNAAVPGPYTLTYTVTDSSGNTATTNRTVLVRGWPSVLGFTAFFSGTNMVTGSPVVQFLAGVNPNGLATVAFVQYGLTTAYPGRTPSVNLPASYNTSTFFATLDGLIPGVTYHFRGAASNNVGVVYGPDQTFTVPLIFAAGDLNGDGIVDQRELNAVLSNYWPHSPWLAMTNATGLSGGLFQFGLTNASGWDFSVLVSTNLVDWSSLPVPARPVWQFLDPTSTNQPQRFYRLRWP